VDWRQKLENQRGAVLATELKNNANKMVDEPGLACLKGVEPMWLLLA
jgi:translation initiation factor 3 subunit D